MRALLLPLLGTLLAATTCRPSSGPSSPPPASPPTGASRATGPLVVLPSGRSISLELASTEEEKAQGLMFREFLARDSGMVFLFDTAEIRPFWMKNCHFPLDMIFTLRDGTVTSVLENVPPCAADPCPSYPPTATSDTVVEVNAGVARSEGVSAGKKVKYVGVPGR